jgi:hypothetical protein
MICVKLYIKVFINMTRNGRTSHLANLTRSISRKNSTHVNQQILHILRSVILIRSIGHSTGSVIAVFVTGEVGKDHEAMVLEMTRHSIQ